MFAKQRYTNTRSASGEYKLFTQSHLRVTGQQSQVEQWEESGASSIPDSGRRAALLAKKKSVCCCLVGFRQGGRPQGKGTWNIRPCHGSSAQLSSALSTSGSSSEPEVAQVWRKGSSQKRRSKMHAGNADVTPLLEARTCHRRESWRLFGTPGPFREQQENISAWKDADYWVGSSLVGMRRLDCSQNNCRTERRVAVAKYNKQDCWFVCDLCSCCNLELCERSKQ